MSASPFDMGRCKPVSAITNREAPVFVGFEGKLKNAVLAELMGPLLKQGFGIICRFDDRQQAQLRLLHESGISGFPEQNGERERPPSSHAREPDIGTKRRSTRWQVVAHLPLRVLAARCRNQKLWRMANALL